MAHITKQANGRWRARYRDVSGHEHSARFDRRVEAQRWLDEVTASLVTGTYVDPKAGRATVGELAPTWLKVKSSKKPKTYAGYVSLCTGHVLPRWGKVPVATITTADVEAWVGELTADGLSASRTRQAYLVLRGVLDTAVKARRLAVNPAQGVELPSTPQGKRRYLTIAELEALADAAGDYGLLVRVLGYCGLRWGEAAELRVADCDLLRSRLIVERSVADVGGRLMVGTTKANKRREVPLTGFLRDALAAHLAGRDPSALVFQAPRGGYLRNSNFRRRSFNAATHAVGLDGLVPHELRHTAASLAIRSGANIKVVQTMMGHASATMTWDRYGHLYDDDLDSVAKRLDAAHAEHKQHSRVQSASNNGHVVELERVR
ncbi:MAG TPA: tyrosine-type recombinase/integrase [Nocardioidaceae bacterium]|nr:tyrosine-type recombinase/integrase [Nocardioidaceae bacterium]